MHWRDRAFRIYWWLEKRIAPEVRFPQYDYEEVLFESIHEGTTWLDVGCGHHILPEWRDRQELELVSRAKLLVGLDPDLASLKKHRSIKNRIRGDTLCLPFRDSSFNLVTANMVVEHLKEPEQQFKEIHRVLKPDGKFIFHTPNCLAPLVVVARFTPDRLKRLIVRFLEGRADEDIFPTFYRCNTESRIREIASRTGFEVVDLRLLNGGGHAVLAFIPPLCVLELLWVKALRRFHTLRHLRGNIIAVLRKT